VLIGLNKKELQIESVLNQTIYTKASRLRFQAYVAAPERLALRAFPFISSDDARQPIHESYSFYLYLKIHGPTERTLL